MRVVADSESADCWRRHYFVSPTVKVDGAVAHHVVEADDVAGYAVVFAVQDGKFVIAGDEILKQRLEGKVEIIGKRRRHG